MVLSSFWRAGRVPALLRRVATRSFTPCLRSTAVALVSLAAIGCSDPVETATGPSVPVRASLAGAAGDAVGADGGLRAMPALRDSILAVRLDAVALPAEMSDAELVTAVRAANGRVFIGFRPAGAAHTSGVP